jgi:hypothetical protein
VAAHNRNIPCRARSGRCRSCRPAGRQPHHPAFTPGSFYALKPEMASYHTHPSLHIVSLSASSFSFGCELDRGSAPVRHTRARAQPKRQTAHESAHCGWQCDASANSLWETGRLAPIQQRRPAELGWRPGGRQLPYDVTSRPPSAPFLPSFAIQRGASQADVHILFSVPAVLHRSLFPFGSSRASPVLTPGTVGNSCRLAVAARSDVLARAGTW